MLDFYQTLLNSNIIAKESKDYQTLAQFEPVIMCKLVETLGRLSKFTEAEQYYTFLIQKLEKLTNKDENNFYFL
jgi:CRISPR/Cas system CSM-associated protein Csm2 small subunit